MEIEGQKFEQYFYYGIDKPGKIKILKAFVYFAFQEAKQYWEIVKSGETEGKIEIITEKLKEIAIRRYKQFYRFVLLNDRPDGQDYLTSEGIIDNNLDKKVGEIIGITIEQMIKTGALEISETKADYIQDYEKTLFEEDENGKLNFWTSQVYRLTMKLEELEEQDPEAYRIKWLQTKMARAKDRLNKQQALGKVEEEGEEVKRIEELLELEYAKRNQGVR